MSFVEKIKQSIILSKFVGERANVKFVRKGQRLWSCCPFHNEDTPSFIVDDSKCFFYCFGCEKGGDVFSFLEKYENKNFSEASKFLCEYLNIPFKTNDYDNSIYNILSIVHEVYRNNYLKSALAQEYVKKRNLSHYDDIGYSHENDVVDVLLQKGYRIEQINKAGICTANGYDRLKNRLIFTIYHGGKIVGFAGRSITNIMPKYINSPETEIFYKQMCLFNDNRANKLHKVIITEGYIDAIQLQFYNAGDNNLPSYNAVSVMGTTISSEQMLKALQINNTVYIMLDNDVAGRSAIYRNLPNILSVIRPGDHIYICHPPEYYVDVSVKDADDILNNLGEVHIKNCINNAKLLSTWIYDYIHQTNSYLPEENAQKLELINSIVNYIHNPSVKLAYKKFLYKTQYIRQNHNIYDIILQKEDYIMYVVSKVPNAWIENYLLFQKYIFRNKTYKQINTLLQLKILDNIDNYLICVDIFSQVFNKYFNKSIKNPGLSHIILKEVFAITYVKDILLSLLGNCEYRGKNGEEEVKSG